MQLIEIGLDHATADVTVRERLAVSSADLPGVLADLRQIAADAVVLSTCNRVEIYLLVADAEADAQRAIAYLADRSGLTPAAVTAATRVRHGADAVRHLCRVTTGLESMIIGEPEIAGQVRAALRAADAADTTSVVTRRLFDDALGVAGQVRQASGIGRHAISVGAAAVRLGERTLGSLDGKIALIVGAGSVGRSAARVLAASGVSRLLILSRRVVSAQATADEVGGEVIESGHLQEALALSDLVVSATSAPHVVIRAEAARAVVSKRTDRPLVIVDVAVPRDVEPAVGEVPGCTLFDVDDLASAREASMAARKLAAVDAEAQIECTVERFMAWWHGRQVAAVVADLVAHAERVRQAEVERSLARHGAATERERALVEATSAAIVKKLLHQPIVELKRRGADDNAEVWARALGELFALPSAIDAASSRIVAESPAAPANADVAAPVVP
ncbi:MAG TPA: glutamyl-tRNA reductase [Chloroflexota bacterium]|nr:glutamyl-tRNA reductase [Chloroflexota bacterium]